jgi:hypothetical protein
MKILNTTCLLESQRDVLERYPKPQAAITPHILCISLLALLTGCGVTIGFKPDKAPGGITGPGQFNPGQFDPGQFNPGPFNPGQFNPGQFNPGPFTSTDGGYGPGAQPVSNPGSNRSTGGGFTIKLTSR